MSDQEKKDKRFGMVVSGIIHASLILIFLFLVAWREPDPPIPEYGIELNLGFQEQGGGDTERDAEALVEDTEEDEVPDAPEETEEVVTPQEEVVEETTPTETETTETVEQTEEVVEDPVTAETSEVAVEEKKEEVQTEEKKEEETKPVEKPKPTVDQRALMGGKKTNTENTSQTSNNQGDDRALMGNQGDKDGQKNTDGNSEDGADIGGVSYSLDGWKWQQPPADKDDSQIDGVIKFAIEVDDRGDVLRVSIVPGTTISDNNIVEFYRKQVKQLRFVQLDPSKTAASISKGTVTFVIKTN